MARGVAVVWELPVLTRISRIRPGTVPEEVLELRKYLQRMRTEATVLGRRFGVAEASDPAQDAEAHKQLKALGCLL